MNKRKHTAFFILFALYITISLAGFRSLGTAVFYASLPMVFAASVFYGYIAGFAAVLLNVPATLLLLYVLGVPFNEAVRMTDPTVILLQCVCVVIPGMIRLYSDKIISGKTRELHRSAEFARQELDRTRAALVACEEQLASRLQEVEFYREKLEKHRLADRLTGLLSREAIIDRSLKYLTDGSRKEYVFIKLSGLKDVNRNQGIFRGDDFLKEKAAVISRESAEAGRISGASFLAICEVGASTRLEKALGDTAEVLIVIPKKTDGVEQLFGRWDLHD